MEIIAGLILAVLIIISMKAHDIHNTLKEMQKGKQ